MIRIHPADNVVIARQQLLGGTAARRPKASPSAAWCRPATRSRCGPSPRASRCAATTRSSASRRATSRRASMCTATTWPSAASTATMPWAATCSLRPTWPTPATFEGIVRADGRVATRNYIGVLTSVNCSATVARAIADHFRRDIHPEALAAFPQRRRRGRADPRRGLRHRQRRRRACACCAARWPAMRATPTSPRCWWSGLGCETNQIQGLLAQEGLREGARLVTFSIQDTRRHRQDAWRAASRPCKHCCPRPTAVQRAAGAGQPPDRGPAMRRLRRLLRHQRQPGAGRGGGPGWCATAAPRSCPRRPRSTAASTC